MHDGAVTAEEMQAGDVRPLSAARPGDRGVIVHVGDHSRHGVLAAEELERRLLELGFVEGAAIELLHEGMIGGDPIAVRVDDMRVALRRLEASAIDVRFESGSKL
ncbi:FeoA family protein [Caulobacter sp. NIBR2454]|uniref:FeoA family protein n=1 Tax=Caulobacter sp. NIBR2454 TaxID=3015996 RepID=UPI0022B6D54E|nr:FeoA family protein [Caulobacter sp. NIBR2454]